MMLASQPTPAGSSRTATSAEDFCADLRSIYCTNPCQVLSIPLWKTLRLPVPCDLRCTRGHGHVTHLEARSEQRLLVYWDTERRPAYLHHPDLTGLTFALAHQDYLPAFEQGAFTSRTPYFRLLHHGTAMRATLPRGFSFATVDMPRQAADVASMIARCYADPLFSAPTVLGWTQHPTFDPALWVWVMDEAAGVPAGLGVAEFDSTIGEGSLEWIQVLPGYRGRGLGEGVVQELLARLHGRAAFTTVSGEVNNPTRPESLYRRCGFMGNDVWWV
ncbi:MAG TPA: GNAT family N-acetyltransferase, partial [Anaerolineae bacterium]